MKTYNYITGKWLTEKALDGETILLTDGRIAKGGTFSGDTIVFRENNALVEKKAYERQWRDSELTRTDPLSLLLDYPRDGTDLLAYRKALADYPSSEGFPNGVRPKPEDFMAAT